MNNTITNKIITNKIIAELEKGRIAWKKDWKSYTLPMNLETKREYSGINMLLLSMNDYSNPYWATFKQIINQKGSVKAGEKATKVIFWKLIDSGSTIINKRTNKPEAVMIPYLKFYNVFNVEQTTLNIPNPQAREIKPIEDCEKIISGYKDCPSVSFDSDRAYYKPESDTITLPIKETFRSDEGYYSTYFHEMVHSTGHKDRLNRFTNTNDIHFGNETYSKEELIAELGNAYLCAKAGISNKTITNSTAYLGGWLKALKADSSMLIQASTKANKAYNYILGEAK